MQLPINMTFFCTKNTVLPAHTAIVVDDDKYVNLALAAVPGLKKFDVHQVYSPEECLDKLKELEASGRYLCKS
jgi:hypothetical protein